MPDYLNSSASWSPYLFAYYASLNLLDAKALFSKVQISTLLDPGVVSTKAPVERHHLFPKAYLSSIGITGTVKTNQIANYAFVEWSDNIEISDKEPRDYFPEFFGRLSTQEQSNAVFHHALPPDWEEMDYFDFLADRRRRIARVVRSGYEQLKHGQAVPESAESLPTVADLLRQMETYKVEFKKSARVPDKSDVPEKVINEEIVKTVAAFMNAGGGTLAIGITDDGDVVGVQPDLDLKHHDLDGYQNWLITLLINATGHAAVAAYTGIRFETLGGEIVCLIDVKPSNVEVFADTIKGKDTFYVRVGNTTRILTGPQIVEYVSERFNRNTSPTRRA